MLDTTPDIAIRFEDLTLGYDRHSAVHHLEGHVKRGSLTAVVGPNGSGKSTLLKGIVGALKPLNGEITISRSERNDMAYLPQLSEIDRSFPITVSEFICLGLWHRIGAFKAVGRGHLSDVNAALAAVGLEGFERRTINALSGGQLQRVLFARVLVQDSPLILLDEPFAAIDRRTTLDLIALVARWHGEGRTIIAVMHDLELVAERFPEAILMARELVAWGSTSAVLTTENLQKARAMSEAWDEQAPYCIRSANEGARNDTV